MDIGLFLTNQQPIGSDQRRALDEQLMMLRSAREEGWDSVFAGQHYLSESLTHTQPVPFLSRLAADAGDMRVGVGILLLALHNPVEVAENFAALDAMTGGRLVFGVGLGYRQVEYDAFGIPSADKVRRFERNLEIIERLWSGDKVDADLPWCRLQGAQLNLLPAQRPRPPIWMAANSDGAVRRAARLADTWMVNPHASVDTIRRQLDLFHGRRREADRPPMRELPAMREVFCAKDRDTALRLARPHLARKYQTYARWGQDQVMPERESFEMPYDDLAAQRFVIGSPEECIEQLLPWRDELGVDHFIFRMHWAGMPIEDSLASLNLMAKEVVPVLRGR